MDRLTRAQQKIFDFVQENLAAGRPGPTLREIAQRFGFRSHRAAACHLEAIKRKGFLESEQGKARSLRLAQASGLSVESVVFIPMLGSIPAGFSREREQESGSDECVPVTVESIGFKPTRNTFALRVQGDSMIGKHICDGDIVVLEHGPDPRSGQIVAALIDRKSTLKTFIVKGRKPFLKAENPKYPDLVPADELMIQGVFRALIRKACE